MLTSISGLRCIAQFFDRWWKRCAFHYVSICMEKPVRILYQNDADYDVSPNKMERDERVPFA